MVCNTPELNASMYCCIKVLFGGQRGGIILIGITWGVNTGNGIGKAKPNMPAFIAFTFKGGSPGFSFFSSILFSYIINEK